MLHSIPYGFMGGLAAYNLEYAGLWAGTTSDYLSRTAEVPTDASLQTFNFCLKLSEIGSDGVIWSQTNVYSASNYIRVDGNSDLYINFVDNSAGAITIIRRISDLKLRDTGDWMNVHIELDSNQTDNTCCVIKINGDVVSDFSSTINPTTPIDMGIDTAHSEILGKHTGGTLPFGGYLARFIRVDGTIVDVLDINEVADNGDFVAKSWNNSTPGNSGYTLLFSNSGDLGEDSSGNGNDWTENGTLSQVTDTPTANLATFDANNATPSLVLSNGNKTAYYSGSAVRAACLSTLMMEADTDCYVEMVADAVNELYFGIEDGTGILAESGAGSIHVNGYYYMSNGQKFTNGGGSAYGATFAATDVIGLWRKASGDLVFYKNGVSQGTAFSGHTARQHIACNPFSGGKGTFRFDPDEWTQTPAGVDETMALSETNMDAVTSSVDSFYVKANDTETNIESTLATARSAFPNYVEIFKNRSSAEGAIVRFSHDTSNEHLFGTNTNTTYQAKSTLSGANNWFAQSFKIDATLYSAAGSVSHTNGGGDTTVTHNAGNGAKSFVVIFPRSGGTAYAYHPENTAGDLFYWNTSGAEVASTRIKTFNANSFVIESAAATDTYDYMVLGENDYYKLFRVSGVGATTDNTFNNLGIAPIQSGLKGITFADSWMVVGTNGEEANGVDKGKMYIPNHTMSEASAGAQTWLDWVSNGTKVRVNINTNEYAAWAVGPPINATKAR